MILFLAMRTKVWVYEILIFIVTLAGRAVTAAFGIQRGRL